MADSEAPAVVRPPALPARKAASSAALPRLLRLMANPFPVYFIGALWATNVTIVALIGTRWACGRDSRVTAYIVAFHAMGLLCPLGAPLSFLKIESWRKAEVDEGRRHPESGGARLRQAGSGFGPVHLAVRIVMFASLVMMIVALLLQDFVAAKGSCLEKFGYALGDMGNFVGSIVLSRDILPRMIVQLKATPM
ncbi:hypothetical protein QOZ80_8AG0630490 [Eleusine coracana subsp. coracana]|nr:hypothetical protein QOZ80_8AG0630490 [Eleusine coracana subsp. coracana]